MRFLAKYSNPEYLDLAERYPLKIHVFIVHLDFLTEC